MAKYHHELLLKFKLAKSDSNLIKLTKGDFETWYSGSNSKF